VTRAPSADRAAGAVALALFTTLFAIYNLNGREIGTTDSQPAKFLAREVAVRGTLTLDRVVAERPGLGLRPAFVRARDGHVRSAYPIVPALIAAVPATLLHRANARLWQLVARGLHAGGSSWPHRHPASLRQGARRGGRQ
jgi:hypothetical protein